MEPYELNNLKTLNSTLIREHSKLMADLSKLDDKKDIKKTQKEIDLLYKLINSSSKLLAFYKENEV
jgi:hypothetical protein